MYSFPSVIPLLLLMAYFYPTNKHAQQQSAHTRLEILYEKNFFLKSFQAYIMIKDTDGENVPSESVSW